MIIHEKCLQPSSLGFLLFIIYLPYFYLLLISSHGRKAFTYIACLLGSIKFYCRSPHTYVKLLRITCLRRTIYGRFPHTDVRRRRTSFISTPMWEDGKSRQLCLNYDHRCQWLVMDCNTAALPRCHTAALPHSCTLQHLTLPHCVTGVY